MSNNDKQEKVKTDEEKFIDLIFGESLEEKQRKSDLVEAQRQLTTLKNNIEQCYQQTEQLIYDERRMIQDNETLRNNVNSLKNDTLPKIGEFKKKLDQSIQEIGIKLQKTEQIMNENLFEFYNFIDETMANHYKMYELLWVQIFYFLDRKRIILNENPQKKMDLINKIIS